MFSYKHLSLSFYLFIVPSSLYCFQTTKSNIHVSKSRDLLGEKEWVSPSGFTEDWTQDKVLLSKRSWLCVKCSGLPRRTELSLTTQIDMHINSLRQEYFTQLKSINIFFSLTWSAIILNLARKVNICTTFARTGGKVFKSIQIGLIKNTSLQDVWLTKFKK